MTTEAELIKNMISSGNSLARTDSGNLSVLTVLSVSAFILAELLAHSSGTPTNFPVTGSLVIDMPFWKFYGLSDRSYRLGWVRDLSTLLSLFPIFIKNVY